METRYVSDTTILDDVTQKSFWSENCHCDSEYIVIGIRQYRIIVSDIGKKLILVIPIFNYVGFRIKIFQIQKPPLIEYIKILYFFY